VNVAPVFVAAVPFGALACALALAAIAAIPRAVAQRIGLRRRSDGGL
jgi:hypothetical protein